jgi:acetyl esterase/lipase
MASVLFLATLATVGALALSPAASLAAQDMREAPADTVAPAAPAPGKAPAGRVEYTYGADPLQRLDFWRAAGAGPAPLILFVHGGGWKRGDKNNATGTQKVGHFLHAGYAFASIDYRLVPAATVEQQAGDVAASLAWLRSQADKLGIDASRIVLMGHSAGAHLVTLVGTDPRYLAAAGLSPDSVRGVVALDGAAYDVPRQIADAGRFMYATYEQAFGSDPARQRALSPTFQAAAPNAPAFLLIHIDRTDGKAQSEALAAALHQAGTPVEVHGVGGTGLRGHLDLNSSLGDASAPATALVDDWLGKLPGLGH